VKAWRFFDHAPELASDEKIKGIAAVPLDASPLNSTAKLLRTCNEVDWHTLLARTHKDYDMKVVIKASQIDLLNVLKIDEQQLVTQFNLVVEIRMPNAQLSSLSCPVFYTIRDHSQCKRLDPKFRLFEGFPIGHHPWEFHNLSDPTPINFLLDLNQEFHGLDSFPLRTILRIFHIAGDSQRRWLVSGACVVTFLDEP
jgi:hypothetical protein